ncbi:MAG: alpha/beta hydrolase, partial [Flavobacteriales bacterium]|nr:alpha/beta hydrolase [Flavobacteriales bacterium]
MKQILLSTLFLSICNLLSAQTPCDDGRYSSTVFSDFTKISNITYGSNTSWTGGSTTLKMDFYEPEGDTETERPLLVWVHGGSFIGGSKTDPDMVEFSERFSKMGYACASIDYRLGFFPFDSANAVKAVVRAVQDLRGAVRYFYKDKQTVNQYKIDTNKIFIGGSSAGAITALHMAYLDDACKISDYLNESTISSMGGLEGTSGSTGYSSDIQCVVNGCGALARYSWIEIDDVPLCSIHGTADDVVKYNRGVVDPGTPL